MNKRSVAILWRNCGPYHLARIAALQQAANESYNFYSVEVSDSSSEYAWSASRQGLRLVTLFRGTADREVSNLRLAIRLWAWLNEKQIDILFLPSFWPAYALWAMVAARLRGTTVVLMTDSTLRSGNNRGINLLQKRLISRCYAAAFVSGHSSFEYAGFLGFSPKKVHVGCDVVDNDYFEARADYARRSERKIRSEFKLPDKYILYLGRFIHEKNLFRVIDAYASAVSQGWTHGNRLLFVGRGPLYENLRAHARQMGLRILDECKEEPQVADGLLEFREFAQGEDVPNYYAFATALVLASHSETWGLVINEAMASGCPVIASDAVGCAEDLLEHQRTALTFSPFDSDGLAKQMRIVCSDQGVRARLIVGGKEKISEWGLQKFVSGVVRTLNVV